MKTSEAWRSDKILTRLCIMFLLFTVKKSDIAQADSIPSPDHFDVTDSLPSQFSASNTFQARSQVNPSSPIHLTSPPEAIRRTRRSPAGPLDLSAAASGGGYGGGGYSSCDCSGFDLIGLIAGGAALAAVATFLINQLINNGGGRAFGLSFLPNRAAEMVAVTLPQPTDMFALKAINRTCDVISDMERRQISVVESRGGEHAAKQSVRNGQGTGRYGTVRHR